MRKIKIFNALLLVYWQKEFQYTLKRDFLINVAKINIKYGKNFLENVDFSIV